MVLLTLSLVVVGLWNLTALRSQQLSAEIGTLLGHVDSIRESDPESSLELASQSLSQVEGMIDTLLPVSTPFRQGSPLSHLEQLLILARESLESAEALSVLYTDQERLLALALEGDAQSLLPILETVREHLWRLHHFGADMRVVLQDFPLLMRTQIPYDSFLRLRQIAQLMEESGGFFSHDVLALQRLLGVPDPHHTVFFFQNSAELRATGGFIGSLAQLKSVRGDWDFHFRDVYEVEWSNGSDEPIPEGFDRLVRRLHLRDANTSRDLPTTAIQMRLMLEESGVDTPDTMIFITDDLLWRLIELAGGVSFPQTQEVLEDPHLAPMIVSFFIEGRHFVPDRENPKGVLPEFIPQIVEGLSWMRLPDYWDLLREIREKRWVQVVSSDPVIQRSAEKWHIDGRLRDYDTADSLAIVTANVSGNKSDAFIEEEYFLRSVYEDSSLQNTLAIQREFVIDEAKEELLDRLLEEYGPGKLEPELMRSILFPERHVAYTQVYIPEGATDIAVDGIPRSEITIVPDLGFTRVGFRFPEILRGEAVSATVRYRIPTDRDLAELDLYVSAQAGKPPTQMTWQVRDGETQHEAQFLLETDTWLRFSDLTELSPSS